MKIQNNFASIEQMMGSMDAVSRKAWPTSTNTENTQLSFHQVLEQTKDADKEVAGGLKFSKHANQRLESRNIDLTKNQLKRLEDGTKRAREKGIKESLVMVDNLAFIVNVKNNTVVTAVNDSEDTVFTNIDGAVIG